MLNVAVIGCGMMGKSHVRLYSELGSVNLVAVTDADKEVAGSIAKKYNIRGYTDHKEMLSKEKIDLVSIAVPTSLHKSMALDCIAKGIHILIEKPITSNCAEGFEVIKAAKSKGVRLMVGHIERFNPAIIELKKRIENGELGRVYKVDVNRVGPFPQRIRDVGVVIDLAVHDIDIMRFILNSDVERLYAETEQKLHTKCEDLLSALMKFRNQTVCNLNINWVTPTKIRKLFVTGEKGMFVVDYLLQDIYFYQNKDLKVVSEYDYLVRGVSEGHMIKFSIDKKEPLKAELEHFIDCVVNKKEPLISGEDGLKALDIAQKMIVSANEHKIINF
jgi:predicted dehydrogenase